MMYDKQNYIGKSIQLYPGDTVKKYGKILNVDDLGWTIEIIDVSSCNDTYTIGDVIFISHSKSFIYKILQWKSHLVRSDINVKDGSVFSWNFKDKEF